MTLRGRLQSFAARAALVALLVTALDAPALTAPFLWDDFTTRSLARMSTAQSLFVPGGERLQNGIYRPVSQLSAVIDERVWGDAAFGWHLTNLLLHGSVVIAAAFLLRRLGTGDVFALAAAALIGVHPAGVDVIWWISARNDSLATLFGLTALLWAAREGAARPRAWLCGLSLFLSLLCKESAVMWLPLALAIAWKDRRVFALPIGVAALAYGVLRFNALGGSVVPVSDGETGLPVASWLGAAGFYTRQALLPLWYRPLLTHVPASVFFPIAGAAALTASGVLFARAWRAPHLRVAALGVAWAWLALVPAILTAANPVSTTALADRHLYAALPGLALAATRLGPLVPMRVRLPMIAAGFVACSALLSYRGHTTWSDETRLWERIVREEPYSRYALANLAGVKLAAGDREAYVELLERAASSPEKSDFLRTEVTMDLASAYLDTGRHEDALRVAGGIREIPADRDSLVRYAVLQGRLLLASADRTTDPAVRARSLELAHQRFRTASSAGATSPGLRYYEGMVLERLGERVDALAAHRRASLDASRLADAARARIAVLEAAIAGERDESVRVYENARALQLAGNAAEALPLYRELAGKDGPLKPRAELRVNECLRQLDSPRP